MKKIQSFKKYSIGFILGISIAAGTTYAANNGSIGALFQYLNGTENGVAVTNVWRLEGENIKDGTVTSFEIEDDTITSIDINNTFEDTLQKTITGTCGINSSIRIVNTDGTVVCEADTDTQLSETTVEDYLTNDTSINYVIKDVGSKLGNSSIYDNGSIGIGTNIPGAKLDVNGEIRGTVFRDGNSGYYTNPASTSNLNAVIANTYYDNTNPTGANQLANKAYVDAKYAALLAAINASGGNDCININISTGPFNQIGNKEHLEVWKNQDNLCGQDEGAVIYIKQCINGGVKSNAIGTC